MPTLSQMFEFSQLAQAAYAHLEEPAITDALTNQDTGEFSTAQALQFTSTNGYQLINHQPNDSSGFSASLFKNKITNEITIAFRGTEFAPPLSNLDPGDIVADADILTKGYARQQIISAYNYYQRLIAPAGQAVNQLVEELTDQPPTDGRLFTTLPGTTQFLSYRVEASGVGLGTLLPTDHVTVTGHSLGGHLAVAFSRLFSGIVDHVYTYNAPGFGTNFTNLFFNLIPEAGNAFDSSKITNVYGEKGPELIADLHTRFGEAIPVFIETATHSKRDLTDALALYDLFARIDPALNLAPANVDDLLNAMAATPTSSLEMGLDALRKLFQGPPVSPTPLGNREAYYTNVLALRSALPSGPTSPFQIDSLVTLSSSTVYSQAKASTADGLAYRYALKELNPFVVRGVDYQTVHNQGLADSRPLDLYDSATGQGTWTLVALSDRAELLAEKIKFTLADGTPGNRSETLFVDATTGFDNQRGATATQVVIFDADGNDLIGRSGNDHLYGGAGDDSIQGREGHDYIEGNEGNDFALSGGAGNDIILGQQGNDQLFGEADNDRLNGGLGDDRLDGGTGLDTYFYRTGQGLDRIVDADKSGTILFDNQTLVGGIRRQGTPADTYVSPDGQFTYLKSGANLVINNSLTIENFDFTTGALGIQLADTGDLASSDLPTQGPVEATIQGTPLADFLQHEGFLINDLMSGGLGNDWFEPWFGDDRVFGEGGDDFLRGGTGRDVLDGGDGIDRLEGDASQFGDVLGVPDQDYLDGGAGAGADLLFGGLRNTFVMVKRAA